MAPSPPPTRSKSPSTPRPSASVVLVSPRNEILLLHRVRSSNSFPSAHVFPGGNLDAFHDGDIPAPDHPTRHQDGPAYRMAAIREAFEESGILLARNNGFGRLVEVENGERDEGRKRVHRGEVRFEKWLAGKGGRADVDNLIPFTRWITPAPVPKRFTTQMYLYFLPLNNASQYTKIGAPLSTAESLIPDPTTDGGIEHTAARFLPAEQWISMQHAGEVMMFPPQVYLLSIVAEFLHPTRDSTRGEELQQQRQKLRAFLRESEEYSPWGTRCISPVMIARSMRDGRSIMALDKPGWEVQEAGRSGDRERCSIVDFRKEGPRRVDIRWKREVLEEERRLAEQMEERGKL